MTLRGAQPTGWYDQREPGVERTWLERLSWPARAALTAALLGLGAVALLALSPGGFSDPDPIQVTHGLSASGYRFVAEWIAGAPSWLPGLLYPASEVAVLILVGLLAVAGWRARRRGLTALAGVALTGYGTLVAYLTSEAWKLVVDQERPCRAVPDVPFVPDCPPIGDWSFPSNHSTIAGGLAVGLVLIWPRLAGLALPVGVAAAGLRVLAGVHYPHDALAGFVLGGTVAAAAVIMLITLVARMLGLLARVPGFGLLLGGPPPSATAASPAPPPPLPPVR